MPSFNTFIRTTVVGTLLLCAPIHAAFFVHCQKAIRVFLPWVGISTEGLQFHWIQRALAKQLLVDLENDTVAAMAAGLEPNDAFQSARRLSRRWLQENPVEPGTAVFAAPRLHEWVVSARPHTYEFIRRRPPRALGMTPSIVAELTPRVADHFRRGPGSPENATGRAEHFLAKNFKVRRTFYTTLDHVPVAGAVELSARDLLDGRIHYLLLCPPDNIALILADVSRRLESLRDMPQTPENVDERLRIFTTAVYGYYQAYPFERGTHPLGHALFRGFFSAFFGHDLVDWPSEDHVLDFLVVSQARFVELMMPLFKGSLIGSHP